MAITISNIHKSIDGSYTGYCHTIKLKVGLDGSVVNTKDSSTHIMLGNQGDRNITQLVFDISALDEVIPDQTKTLSEYQHVLIFNFDKPQVTANGLNYVAYQLTSNETFDEDTYEVIPALTSEPGTYRMIYALLEKVGNIEGGNTNGREIFISKEFTGTVNATEIKNITEEDIFTASEIIDTERRFTKSGLLINPSTDHYTISSASNVLELGEKRDQFIKRIILNEGVDSSLDEGLDYRVACFGNKTTNQWTLTRMFFNNARKNICSCFIPSEITTHAGTYQLFLIAQTDIKEEDLPIDVKNFKRWVSNSLTLTVKDNFLNDDADFFIVGSEENVYTSDNVDVISADNVLVDTKDVNGLTVIKKQLSQNFEQLQADLNAVEKLSTTAITIEDSIILDNGDSISTIFSER